LKKLESKSIRLKKTTKANPLLSQITILTNFLDKIPQETIVSASIYCSSFARALLHQEHLARRAIESNSPSIKLQKIFGTLQQIYASLDDSDSLEGMASKILNPTLEQKILQHEVCGQWPAAQTCYEILLQQKPNEMRYQIGLLECLQNMGHYGITILNFRIHKNIFSWNICRKQYRGRTDPAP
jgi:serine/threonine-protein kinase ATR